MDGAVDLAPVLDHVWGTFGDGDRLQPYALGADLVGEEVDASGDSDACWAPEGEPGWVGGHLEGADGTVDLAVSVDGVVEGTAPTFDDGEHGQAVFVLYDPAADGDVALWEVDDGVLKAIEPCG
jgi:hypothetical protein